MIDFDIFDSFPKISTKQWKQKIQFELEGDDYNKRCIWQSAEEIAINSFYNAETTASLRFFSERNTQLLIPISENITNDIFAQYTDFEQFIINNTLQKEFIPFLDKLPKNKTFFFPIHQKLSKQDLDKIFSLPNIQLLFDPIGNLAKTGNFFENKSKDIEIWKSIFYEDKNLFIDAQFLAESGATHLQQIAYTLAILSDYISFLEETPTSFRVTIQIASLPDLYLEAPKIKALRWLFESIFNINKSIDLEIISNPSTRFTSFLKDEKEYNEIRYKWTLQGAIWGGCNYFIPQKPFEATININFLEFCRKKIKENTTNPINNSFYFDTITYQMAQKSLRIWQSIVSNKGFLSQLKNHIIQRKIKEKSRSKNQDFYSDFSPQNTNLQEFAKEFLHKKNYQKTLLEPILPKRVTEFYEQKFLKNEQNRPFSNKID